MVKLFNFNSGDVILSTEVNANFNALAQIVGTKSTSDTLALPGKIALGARDAATISALTDTVTADDGYLHMGWNASETVADNGSVKLNRTSGLADGATALRVGSKGLAVLGTSQESGDLNTTIKTLFAIRQNNRIFVNPSLSFTSVDNVPGKIDGYRLTYVPLADPVKVYETANIVDKGQRLSVETTRKMQNWLTMTGGYRGVQLRVAARRTANMDNAARIEVYGQGTDPVTGILFFANNTGLNVVKGPVFFHKGATGNDTVVIEVVHELASLRIDIVGVWK